ncbi:3-dehydroquinate synthase, partial [Vibrio cholerae]|nr:3-dehydroquinate synthase [Vibrio cholerae]
MERITVNLAERSYPISIGAGLFVDPAYLSQVLSNKNTNQKVVVISNATVAPLYANKILHQLTQLGCDAS